MPSCRLGSRVRSSHHCPSLPPPFCLNSLAAPECVPPRERRPPLCACVRGRAGKHTPDPLVRGFWWCARASRDAEGPPLCCPGRLPAAQVATRPWICASRRRRARLVVVESAALPRPHACMKMAVCILGPLLRCGQARTAWRSIRRFLGHAVRCTSFRMYSLYSVRVSLARPVLTVDSRHMYISVGPGAWE